MSLLIQNNFSFLSQTPTVLNHCSTRIQTYANELYNRITSFLRPLFTVHLPAFHTKSVRWFSARISQLYFRMKPVANASFLSIAHFFNTTTNVLWSHRKIVAGGIILGSALLTLFLFWKQRPQPPLVTLESTLDRARLTIRVPKLERLSPNVTLTFCIDTSGSMNGERLDAVKKGISQVLDKAQKVIDSIPGTKIQLAVIQFRNQAELVTPFTSLSRGSRAALEAITTNALEASGSTAIICGLEKATEELEKIASQNPNTKHAVILLTDGEDNLPRTISSLQARLANLAVQLFAVGIGAEHKRETLQTLTQNTSGTYIDTTKGLETIESAISSIYAQVIATFPQFTLSTRDLESGSWSVLNSPIHEKGFILQATSEDTDLVKYIKIDSSRLSQSVDLSNVTFTLTFVDNKKRAGSMTLPWLPNTLIDPKLINAAEAEDKKA
jgi:Mg-chelatase subunit ChlD